ncbi:MT-A70 family methyltransferase [Oceaniradius stylonematis]|uniref:MT-A70 family methyltransferase n=1 Tax=Oceaniradius stylonematis TaxID=2184161 RepID=UPI00273F9F86|nr:MT-A70 family methyltransferase [Oceaniradius stylonematis]
MTRASFKISDLRVGEGVKDARERRKPVLHRPDPITSDMYAEFAELRCTGGYRVILADNPWPWAAYSNKGTEKSPEAHYETMSVDEICAIPVELLAADDCALFMWVTWPLMPQWASVLRNWGFNYAGLAWEWIKFNPETGKYAFGPGYGTRKNLEPCLLATRGNPSLRSDLSFFGIEQSSAGARSVRDFIEAMPLDCIRAPRREHSRKPDEQYTRIETMFDGPYLELFSRSNRQGWTSWGHEAGRFGEVA